MNVALYRLYIGIADGMSIACVGRPRSRGPSVGKRERYADASVADASAGRVVPLMMLAAGSGTARAAVGRALDQQLVTQCDPACHTRGITLEPDGRAD